MVDSEPASEPASDPAGEPNPSPSPLQPRLPTACLHLPVTEVRNRGSGRLFGGRAGRVRGRRRTGVGLPVLQSGLSDPDPAGRRGHGADRPGQPRRRLGGGAASRRRCARRTANGSCTRPTRICPAWPRSACARPRCTTPNWRAGWPGSTGSTWPPWSSGCSGSGWPRGTARPTGRSGPLPDAWLNYAALDVEVLIELREAIAAVLAQQGKVGLGRPRVRASAHLRRPADPARPLAAHVGHPQGA